MVLAWFLMVFTWFLMVLTWFLVVLTWFLMVLTCTHVHVRTMFSNMVNDGTYMDLGGPVIVLNGPHMASIILTWVMMGPDDPYMVPDSAYMVPD